MPAMWWLGFGVVAFAAMGRSYRRRCNHHICGSGPCPRGGVTGIGVVSFAAKVALQIAVFVNISFQNTARAAGCA